MVRNAPRRMLEKDLNTINGAPNKWSPMICCVKVPVVLHLLWFLGFGGYTRDRTADLLNAIQCAILENTGFFGYLGVIGGSQELEVICDLSQRFKVCVCIVCGHFKLGVAD